MSKIPNYEYIMEFLSMFGNFCKSNDNKNFRQISYAVLIFPFGIGFSQRKAVFAAIKNINKFNKRQKQKW